MKFKKIKSSIFSLIIIKKIITLALFTFAKL